jgi:uncharacterized protein GlcG (DUF336 family)
VNDYLSAAVAAVAAGVAHASELGVRVAVIVLDRTTTPVALQRMDGAYLSTVDVAKAKAHTAVNFGAPTSALAGTILPENKAALQAVVPQLMFVAGGVPVRAGGELLGAVGVSGASADQDRACAEAAAVALSTALGG